jgi:uncharacterized protein YbjT (DUF2867 family)
MTSPILLTGGSGTLGRRVTPLLQATGHRVRILSRTTHLRRNDAEFVVGDLTTGDGVEAAVEAVELVIHCGGSPKGDDHKTETLIKAARRAGVKHLVYISVVGADRVPVVSGIDRAMFGYYAAKRASEQLIARSGLPWTTLRATQFHDAILTAVAAMAKLPVVPVPAGVRFQPVDVDEVAARLAQLALDDPAGLVPDIAGPRVYEMADLLRSYLRAHGKHRLVLPVKLIGAAGRAIRAGANLNMERAIGRRTWEQFLDDQTATEVDRNQRLAATAGSPR